MTSHIRYDKVKAAFETERVSAGVSNQPITDAWLAAEHRILPVHPKFRIVGLAAPPPADGGSKQSWLSAETVGLFSFHSLPTLGAASFESILRARHARLAPEQARALVDVSQQLSAAAEETGGSGSATLSPRQLLRVARRIESRPEDLRGMLDRTCLGPLLPEPYRESFRNTLDSVIASLGSRLSAAAAATATAATVAGRPAATVPAPASSKLGVAPPLRSSAGSTSTATTAAAPPARTVEIGDVSFVVGRPAAPELVPDTFFVDIPSHTALMTEMAKDLSLGENHLLLIGPQGTGKNKVADRLLHTLGWEREYIQLHRDTTVQSLTVDPQITGGAVSWLDTPLVSAVRNGRVLMVDEADKAPLEVVSVLKGLVEDGQLALTDGRMIVRPDQVPEGTIATPEGL